MSHEPPVKISGQSEMFSPLDRWNNEYSRWQKFAAISSTLQNFWRFCRTPMCNPTGQNEER